MKKNQFFEKIIIIIFWVVLWQLVSLHIDSKLIMAGPVQTAQALFRLMCSYDFIKTILFSSLHIISGFFLALVISIFLAPLSHKYTKVRAFFHPFFLLIRSIPVASFVILALLWVGSESLSILISFLISLPVIYTQLLTAEDNIDKEILEMADIFCFSLWSRICAVYIPGIRDYFLSAVRLAVGMSFKAGIAAEVIACSAGSIGEKLYMAKIYFSTGDLFAWTVVIVVLSFICEKAVFIIIKSVLLFFSSDRISLGVWKHIIEKDSKKAFLSMDKVCKSYDGVKVLDCINFNIKGEGIVLITGKSGQGKSTILKIITGKEKSDYGSVCLEGKFSAVFQNQRLIENCNPITNVLYSIYGAHGSFASEKEARFTVEETLRKVLPEKCLKQKICQLSGGERRRVEIIRALLSSADIILMDEPFTGLDEANREKLLHIIKELSEGRILVIAVHDTDSLGNLDFNVEIKV